MNKEIMKAMSKKKESNEFRKWWRKNDYKIMRVIFFPIWFSILAKEKIEKYLNSRTKWNEERANKILQYYIPRRASWDEEDKLFFFFDNGYGWNQAKKYLKRRDRRFWNSHCCWRGGNIRKYLIEKFELEGFTKEVCQTYDDQTEIIFKLGVDKQPHL